MINDKELSNLDLDLLYSKSNIRNFYKPEKVNIITTYSTDKLPGQQSLEDNNIDIFKDCGHAVIFHRWHPSKSAHWLTLLRDLENNVLIFDSLGSNGMQKNKKKFNLLLKRLKDNGYKKITVNRLKRGTKWLMKREKGADQGMTNWLFNHLSRM